MTDIFNAHNVANGNAPTWPAEDTAVLLRSYETMSAGAVAALPELGGRYSRNAVIGKLHRMGLKKPVRLPSADSVYRRELRRRRAAAELASPSGIKTVRASGKKPLGMLTQKEPVAPRRQVNKFDAWQAIEFAPIPDSTADQMIPIGQRKSLFDLRDDECRFVVGDPHEADYFFCAAPVAAGLPYCPAHAARCYHTRSQMSLAEAEIYRRRKQFKRNVPQIQPIGE